MGLSNAAVQCKAKRLVSALVSEDLDNQIVVGIVLTKDLRIVFLDVLADSGCQKAHGNLVGVEAVNRLDQLPGLATIGNPCLDD